MSKVIKYHCYVEYRTNGGSCHSWSGYAEDEGDAEMCALDESYCSMCADDWYHSCVSVDLDDSDTIEEQE